VKLPVTVGLGIATGAGLFGATLFVLGGPRGAGLGVLRWLGAIVLLGLVVGVLVRYGPAERPRARWASVGAVVVVGTWVVASILFRLYVSEVANFRTPVGSLTGLLVLTGYIYVSAIVFLVGVQLDELLRKSSGGQAKGAAELIWEAIKR
jgi:membrane protein